MCGIAGIHVFNPDNVPDYLKMENTIDQLLASINHRGGDATGFVAISEEETVWQKASCNAFDFYKERKNIPWRMRSVLMHTRMATQGSAAFPENNHPVRRGSVYIVHNGHIWNDWDIFKKTSKERYGQVDSEAIAAIISKYGIDRTHEAMEELSGAAAIGVIDEKRPGLMVIARGSSSPLMFYRNENLAVFASTTEAIKKAWTTLYGTPPSDNKIVDVDEGTALYLYDSSVETKRFTPDDYYMYSGGWSNSKKYGTASGWDGDSGVGSGVVAGYGKKEDGPKVTFVGTSGNILCSHGCDELDCDVCNPDDYYGSYLPERAHGNLQTPRIYNEGEQTWINATQCELCNHWFGEDELVKVKDFEDKWLLCDDCFSELADVISDCDMTRPVRIHGLTNDEILSL